MKKQPDIIQDAQTYAIQAHKRIDQRRKYTNQPYDVHLKAVAESVESITNDEEMIAAAWLHDTIEDTTATFHDIEQKFGKPIFVLVSELTDVSKPSDGNRAVRKSIDRAHLSQASSRAKTIKLADIIDNCQDICKNDKRFARTFIAEAMLLMEVLTEGDSRLYQEATQVIKQCADELGFSYPLPMQTMDDYPLEEELPLTKGLRPTEIFINAFSAKDIVEPLHSFGGNEKASEVAEILKEAKAQVAGVQQKGQIAGYVFLSDLDDGPCKNKLRRFQKSQVISSETSFTEVIHVLTRYKYCFVTMCGTVFGVIDRSDIQKPVVRMWLFGMITIIEMYLLEHINTTFPGDSWKTMVSTARLQKAENLFVERTRRNYKCSLIDCLQLSDKITIISKDKEFINASGFKSKRILKQTMKELNSLRDNLAHAQDIVTHDWPRIVQLVKNMESRLRRS